MFLSDPAPGAAGAFVGYTWTECHSGDDQIDQDRDGLRDSCEAALASGFAPVMQFTHNVASFIFGYTDCTWDATVEGSARVGGDYRYAVHRNADRSKARIHVAYLPGYYRDCGATQPYDGFTRHSGDSEFILVALSYRAQTAHWVLDSALLSAHCGSAPGGNCRWYSAVELEYWENRHAGRPLVWVSGQKHANYAHQDDCSSGQGSSEFCSNTPYFTAFPVKGMVANIGNPDYPHPYRTITATDLPRHCDTPLWESQVLRGIHPAAYSSGWRECWWYMSGTVVPGISEYQKQFCGYVGGIYHADCATPYGTILRNFAGIEHGQGRFSPELLDPWGPSDGRVYIQGPSVVQPGARCSYHAVAISGTPIGYAWSATHEPEFNGNEGVNITNSGGTDRIAVRVDFSDGTSSTATLLQTVDSSTPMCWQDVLE